jgi:superfamily II DNA or RNA helicase/HKD family nuclease
MSQPIVPGAYDQLITAELADLLEGLPAERVLREALGPDNGPVLIARHLYFLVLRSLRSIKNDDDSQLKIQISNKIIEAVSEISAEYVGPEDLIAMGSIPVLSGVLDDPANKSGMVSIQQPQVPLSQSALLVNGLGQPSIGGELQRELTSANNVDVIISFLKFSGVKIIGKELEGVINRGGTVRVITTTYMGATERAAVDRLCKLGAQVKISYDVTGSRLHAKAWIIKRDSGSTTGYVGSSNMSKAALMFGTEWNLRVSNSEQPHIIDHLSKIFDESWADPEYCTYELGKDAEKLDQALKKADSWSSGKNHQDDESDLSISYGGIEVEPRLFQQEVLDALESERLIHGRFNNLVVMATGTGKTVVSALDFKRLFHSGEVKSLLFIAHRQEILKQSRRVFRDVMKSGTFGEMFVDGQKPSEWKFVFASVQSLLQMSLDGLEPAHFDMIIVDEFHHYPAKSYVKPLNYFKPKYLLGLTATPERTDGKELLEIFGGVFAAELRLWEAINREFLCPFQYFGIHDNIDLDANVKWVNGHYDETELSNLYTADDIRVGLILKNLKDQVADMNKMKAIGFCVDVSHAKYMAGKFTTAGIPSVFVVGETPSAERDKAILDLKSGAIKVIFAVDIYNEGVDIPDVNTLMMLRPTESGVVFIQQLGRGLRKTPTKECLLVLDFVGNQNKKFRFDVKYGKLLGLGKKALAEAIQSGFPPLPSGCHFELDEVASKIITDNLKESIGFNKKQFKKDIARLGDVGIGVFLDDTGIDIADLYRGGNSFTVLKKYVFEENFEPTEIEEKTAASMKRFMHVDDLDRLKAFTEILQGKEPADLRFRSMFASLLLNVDTVKVDFSTELSEALTPEVCGEFLYLMDLLKSRIHKVVYGPTIDLPLQVHGHYSRGEVYAAFGASTSGKFGKGVEWVQSLNSDLAFVTIRKSEGKYTPTTMYADTAVSDHVFQWESQSTTSENTPTGARYINHKSAGSSFHLFVREIEDNVEIDGTMPYAYLGTCNYLSHTGNKPMRILWELDRPMPAEVLMKSKILAS